MFKSGIITAAVAAAIVFAIPSSADAQYPGYSSGISPFSYSYNYMTTGNPYNYGQYNYPYRSYYPGSYRRSRTESRYNYRTNRSDLYDKYRNNRYDRNDRYDRYDRNDRYNRDDRRDTWYR